MQNNKFIASECQYNFKKKILNKVHFILFIIASSLYSVHQIFSLYALHYILNHVLQSLKLMIFVAVYQILCNVFLFYVIFQIQFVYFIIFKNLFFIFLSTKFPVFIVIYIVLKTSIQNVYIHKYMYIVYVLWKGVDWCCQVRLGQVSLGKVRIGLDRFGFIFPQLKRPDTGQKEKLMTNEVYHQNSYNILKDH